MIILEYGGNGMDIMAQITALVEEIQKGKSLIAKFQKDPVKTVADLLGVDLPDDQINKIVEGVKAKITPARSAAFWAGSLAINKALNWRV